MRYLDLVAFRAVARSYYYFTAGWSSLVARRAHNPEVIGSNPVPAPNIKIGQPNCAGPFYA